MTSAALTSHMRSSMVVVDGFYADPAAVRNYALRQRYYSPYDSAADVRSGLVRPVWYSSWFREAADCPFKRSLALIERLEEITGEEIDREHWNASFPLASDGRAAASCTSVESKTCLWNCGFQVKLAAAQPLGAGVHNHVTDTWNSVGEDGWAGVLYLTQSSARDGGLRLWQNRDPRRDFDWMTPPSNWQLRDELANVYNRLVLVRGNIPHSGAAGWGTSLADGRLFQTFFFKVREPRIPPALVLRLD